MTFYRGDIVLCKMNSVGEHTQHGTRPAIIIQNNTGNKYSETLIVIPLTSRVKKPMPTHCFIPSNATTGIIRHSTAMCEQITTIGKEDVIRKTGNVSSRDMERLEKCIACSLGLDGEF